MIKVVSLRWLIVKCFDLGNNEKPVAIPIDVVIVFFTEKLFETGFTSERGGARI